MAALTAALSFKFVQVLPLGAWKVLRRSGAFTHPSQKQQGAELESGTPRLPFAVTIRGDAIPGETAPGHEKVKKQLQ
jgi:hypothetical protein